MRGGLAAGLLGLAVASTALEGGGSPDGTLLVHAGVALLAIAALLAPAGEGRRLPPAMGWGLAAFAAAVLASACLAPYGFAAWLAVQDVAVGLGVLLLAARAPEARGSWARLALLAAAAGQGVVALVQATSGTGRAAGTLFNPNHLAAWTTAAGLAALPPLLGTRGRLRAGALVLSIGVLLALGASRSRGAALGLVLGTACLVALRWESLGRGTRRVAVAAALGAALLAAGLFALRLREDDPYRWTRTRIWAASLDVARASPLAGCGPGQFATAAAGVRFANPVGPLRWDRNFSTPHSDLLRLPAEFGLPAALAAAFALACGLRAAVRRGRAPDGLGSAASLAGFLALAAQAAVDDLTTRPALVVLGALLLGSAASLERPREAPLTPSLRWRLALAAVLLVALLAGDAAPWLSWRTLAGVPRPSDTEEGLTRALAWNPVHPDLHLRRAERHLRRGLRDASDYAAARTEAETAVRLSPADVRYRVGLARVEATACRTLFPDVATRSRAAAQYAAAAALAPFDPRVALEEGEFLLASADPAGALRAAEEALRLEPEALPPRRLLARALQAIGGAAEVARARALRAETAERQARNAALPLSSSYARYMLR